MISDHSSVNEWLMDEDDDQWKNIASCNNPCPPHNVNSEAWMYFESFGTSLVEVFAPQVPTKSTEEISFNETEYGWVEVPNYPNHLSLQNGCSAITSEKAADAIRTEFMLSGQSDTHLSIAEQSDQKNSRFHADWTFEEMDMDEWLNDEDELWAKIEHYDESLSEVSAPLVSAKSMEVLSYPDYSPAQNGYSPLLDQCKKEKIVDEAFNATHIESNDVVFCCHSNTHGSIKEQRFLDVDEMSLGEWSKGKDDDQWMIERPSTTLFNNPDSLELYHELLNLKDSGEQSSNKATRIRDMSLEEEIFFNNMEYGQVEVPSYPDHSPPPNGCSSVSNHCTTEIVATEIVSEALDVTHANSSKSIPYKKYTHWTLEDHRLFLIGLNTYGPGNWKKISENVVLTKTPSQVSSHAQKYFQRQNIPKENRKRKSMHDITLHDIDMMVPHHIDQQNLVLSPPSFAMQPQEMQQQQNILQFNLPNNMPQLHQLGGYGYFYNERQNWIPSPNFATPAHHMLQFNLPNNMAYQMGGYR